MNGRVLISWRNSNKLPSVHQQGVFLTHADVATGAEGAGRGSVWPETLPTNELLAEDSWPKILKDLSVSVSTPTRRSFVGAGVWSILWG